MTPKQAANEHCKTREKAEEKHDGEQMRHAMSPLTVPFGGIHKG
jgi:hypothetical protein